MNQCLDDFDFRQLDRRVEELELLCRQVDRRQYELAIKIETLVDELAERLERRLIRVEGRT